MNTDTTFIIADNQDITKTGLHGYIFAIFGECHVVDTTNKKELMQALTECSNSVVILDYTLFDLNGVEEFLIIENRFPDTHWILFSNELSEDFIRRLSIEKNISMILKLIAHGKSVKEIAKERISSIHTIITHKKNIFRKLGVNNVYEATKYALRAGLVDMVEYYI